MKAKSFVSKLIFLRDFNAGTSLHRWYFENWSQMEMLVEKIFRTSKKKSSKLPVDNISPRDLKVTVCDNTDLATVICYLKLPQDHRQENGQTQFQYIKSIPEIVRVPQTSRSVQASWYVSLGTKIVELVNMWAYIICLMIWEKCTCTFQIDGL